MNFTSDKMSIFKNEFTTKGGEKIVKYSTTISRKDKDGDYENIFADVRFNLKDDSKKQRIARFEKNVAYVMKAEGFISFDAYTNKLKETIQKIVFVINDFVPIEKKERKCKAEEKKAELELPY